MGGGGGYRCLRLAEGFGGMVGEGVRGLRGIIHTKGVEDAGSSVNIMPFTLFIYCSVYLYSSLPIFCFAKNFRTDFWPLIYAGTRVSCGKV